MSAALSRKAKATFVLMVSVLALSIALLSGPASAQASTSNYCTGWQSSGGSCEGAGRYMYQVYGLGDQGSVCVAMAFYTGWSCSSGAGSGVYSGETFKNVATSPLIKNNFGGNNFVHGVALTH